MAHEAEVRRIAAAAYTDGWTSCAVGAPRNPPVGCASEKEWVRGWVENDISLRLREDAEFLAAKRAAWQERNG